MLEIRYAECKCWQLLEGDGASAAWGATAQRSTEAIKSGVDLGFWSVLEAAIACDNIRNRADVEQTAAGATAGAPTAGMTGADAGDLLG